MQATRDPDQMDKLISEGIKLAFILVCVAIIITRDRQYKY